MIQYLHTAHERTLLAAAETILGDAAFPSAGWKEVPASPFYVFLIGVHALLFDPRGRSFTLASVMHRVWGRKVPHTTLNELFGRAGLRVRPYQLMLLYRATTIAVLMSLGATAKEVRSLLSLSTQSKIYDILRRAEEQMELPTGWMKPRKDAHKGWTVLLARRLLRSFIPSDKPDHAAWWLSSSGLKKGGTR